LYLPHNFVFIPFFFICSPSVELQKNVDVVFDKEKYRKPIDPDEGTYQLVAHWPGVHCMTWHGMARLLFFSWC
jgi:hypothetical protein